VDGVKWTDVTRDMADWSLMAPRLIEITNLWPKEQSHCYAATYFYSPDDREVRFDIGADDVFVLYVNGREVGRRDAMHWVVVGQDKIAAKLKKGWNEVVLRDGNGPGKWEFCFEVRKPDGSPDPDITAR